MTAVIRRGKVIRGDLALWDGRATTVTRLDASGGTVTGLPIGDEVDVLQVYGSGTNRTRSSIANAISGIGSSTVTLLFAPGTWTIDANLTVPANLISHIPAGCVFAVDSGKTLTFLGPVIQDGSTASSGAGTVVGLNGGESVRGAYYKLTAAESAASVTPINFAYEPYTAKRYATGDGSTDDAAAIQSANNAAAQAGVPLRFQGGTYMVDISSRGSSLDQTTSWLAEPGAQVTIKRKDFTASTAYFTMQQTSQTGLTLFGITFDGQVTTAASSIANQDLAAAGSYSDTTDESKWRKVYGVRLFNATRALVDSCTFTNFLRAGLWIDGDGLSAGSPAISSDVKVSNCNVKRTRSGSAGDGIYVGGATDVKFSNCHVYDYQRIAFVTEFARTDTVTNCRDIEYVNCTADFGHDAVAPESNVGFWAEDADNLKYSNCTAKNTAVGYVCNAGSNADTGSTRPWTASIGYSNCASLRTKIAMRAGFGGTRSVHLTVSNFFGEANRSAPSSANESLGLRAGILVQVNEVTSGVNFRLDFSDIKIHALNQSTGIATNGFGCIRVAQGVVATPQQLVIKVDGLQTQWTLTNGSDDVSALTDFQSVTNGYFGDVVFSGANDTSPDGRFKGHAYLRNLQNHTFGYAFFSSEIQSSSSNIVIEDSRVSMRVASVANNGVLRLANCPLVDFRGDIGWTEIYASNCTFSDANASSKDRTAMSCGIFQCVGGKFTRQLWINLNGGDTTHRKLRLMAAGTQFFVPFDTESGLKFTLADSTFASINLSGCVFRNNGTGSIGATDKMIHVSTATGTLNIHGAGNAYDNAVVGGGGHVIEYNSSPTYNDAPATAATPFLSVNGVLAQFDPV